MKTVLIWDLNIPIIPKGGPSGYLFTIKQELLNNGENNFITFLSDVIKETNPKIKRNEDGRLKTYLKKNRFCLFLFFIYRIFNVYNKTIPELSIDINLFSVIHFHKIDDLYNARKILSKYTGKILLTTHSPESFASEFLYYSFGEKKYFFMPFLFQYLLKKEMYAYSLADNILFPTEYSIEPYETLVELKNLFHKIKNKFVYCPTCINDIPFPVANDLFFKRFDIPKNALVIVYVGRHNEIKGYNYLKKVGEVVLSLFDDVYFVVAGKEAPLKGITHPRWIELGWVKNASEIIYHSDVFVLPNKETYFDLIALEVLRAGTPLILTRTGGNKYLEDLSKSNGESLLLVEYGDVNAAVSLISNLRELKLSFQIEVIRCKNRQLFSAFFQMKNYISTYKKIINEISIEK